MVTPKCDIIVDQQNRRFNRRKQHFVVPTSPSLSFVSSVEKFADSEKRTKCCHLYHCRPQICRRYSYNNFISHNMSKFLSTSTNFALVSILFVLCLQLNHVNGALNLINNKNNNNNNNSNNNVNNTILYDINNDISVSDNYLYENNNDNSQHLNKNRPQPIYLNEFAVYIPNGVDAANDIAHKYGFTNLGQVSSYKMH